MIGRKIRALREERQWTQATLAAAIGSSARYVGHIETGLRQPGIGILRALARVFDTTIDALIAEQEAA